MAFTNVHLPPPSPPEVAFPGPRLRRDGVWSATIMSAKNTAGSLETGKDTKRRPTAAAGRTVTEPLYWHDDDDPVAVVTQSGTPAAGAHAAAAGGGDGRARDDGGARAPPKEDRDPARRGARRRQRKRLRFSVRGNPRALARHRTGQSGFVYNPSRAAQELFRECLLARLPRAHHPTILDDGDDDDCNDRGEPEPTLLFPHHEYLKMSLVFRMKRPKSHFVGNKPGAGRLKPSAPGKLHRGRADVDNLAKFVMDALNGLVYVDDRQVVHLDAIKVLDSEGSCRGATDVDISVVEEEDW